MKEDMRAFSPCGVFHCENEMILNKMKIYARFLWLTLSTVVPESINAASIVDLFGWFVACLLFLLPVDIRLRLVED
jgi:hypothetical protein